MKTVLLGPRPPEIDALIAHRRALGQDTHDEVWEGDYHMAPAAHSWHGWAQLEVVLALAPFARRAGLTGTTEFNLGRPKNFRVPDLGYHRVGPNDDWISTAALVVEVLSPHDETFEKFQFYAQHDVDEILVVHPHERTVRWFARRADGSDFDEVSASILLGMSCADLTAAINWPGQGAQ